MSDLVYNVQWLLGFRFRLIQLPVFITMVELLIKWNHISGVNHMGSTGQVLSLAVSVGSLISVLCQILLAGSEVADRSFKRAIQNLGELFRGRAHDTLC